MTARVTLDSNLLVYAALEPQTGRGRAAAGWIIRAAPTGILAVQALGEFLGVVRRRAPDLLDAAITQIEAWAQVFETAPTDARTLAAASALVKRHGLQIWDAVIWCAARTGGASIFLSEDLHDGFEYEGMRVVNPLAAANEGALASLLDR